MTIRFRLGLALAVALLPVLALGGLQVATEFRRDAHVRQAELAGAAARSGVAAQARIRGAFSLLQTLNPQIVGYDCTPRLAAILPLLTGYRNIVRLDARGRIQCAAAPVVSTLDRTKLGWFIRLRAGAHNVVAKSSLAGPPAVVAATRVEGPDGRFQGALVASILLASLKPDLYDPTLPKGTAVAIVDADGRYVAQTAPDAFGALPADWRAKASGGMLVIQHPAKGGARVLAMAPLIAESAYVVLSAPAPGVFYWARLNPFSAIVYPLLAFSAAWLAVWIVADRVVIRWLAYLDRIASIYARGRFSIRPVQAESAPEEIRTLAHTLDMMAEGLVARDHRLRESLTQKDALMREIHHRVKNNLQVITSLLNMQQRTLTDPAARAAMSDTRQRINALALIYRALYQSPDLRRVDVRQFLEELVGQLGVSEGVGPSAIRTELRADDLEIDPDKLAPLALFAVEAISNARKHAFDVAGGMIDVRFSVGEREVVLEITDNGRGDAAAMPETGVGRTLMSAFARQLRGTLQIGPAPGQGVAVRLTFPRPESPIAEPPLDYAGNQVAA